MPYSDYQNAGLNITKTTGGTNADGSVNNNNRFFTNDSQGVRREITNASPDHFASIGYDPNSAQAQDINKFTQGGSSGGNIEGSQLGGFLSGQLADTMARRNANNLAAQGPQGNPTTSPFNENQTNQTAINQHSGATPATQNTATGYATDPQTTYPNRPPISTQSQDIQSADLGVGTPHGLQYNDSPDANQNPQYDQQGILQPGTGGAPARPPVGYTGSSTGTPTGLQYDSTGNQGNPQYDSQGVLTPGTGGSPASPIDKTGGQTGGNPPPSDAASKGTGAMAASGVAKSYSDAQTAQHNLANPSSEELSDQQKITDLENSKTAALKNIADDPIPFSVKSGMSKNVEDQVNAREQTLSQRLATLMSNRKSQYDQATAEVAKYAPKEVPMGGSLVQAQPDGSFSTVAQGQSVYGKQAASTLLKMALDYPDAGVATDGSMTPEQAANLIATKSQKFRNENTQAGFDPLTGAATLLKTYNAGTVGAAPSNSSSVFNQGSSRTGNTPSGASGNQTSSKFTLDSDGKTVLADGKPVDLQTFRQMTGQTGATTNFSAVQGNKSSSGVPASSSPTGKYIPASSTTSSLVNQYSTASFNPNSDLDTNALTYAMTGVNPAKMALGSSAASIPAVAKRAQQLWPGFNPEVSKANAKTLGELMPQQAKIAVSFQKFEGDVKAIAKIADQVNSSGIGGAALNDFVNSNIVKFGNDPKVNSLLVSYRNLLQTARGDYAIINAGGGAPDDKNQSTAADAVPSGQASQVYLNGILTTGQGEAKRKLDAQQQQIIKASTGTGQVDNINGHKTGDIIKGGDGKSYKVNADGTYSPQ